MDQDHAVLSIQQQGDLVGLSRAAYYYTPVAETSENLQLLRLLDAQSLVTPFYGSRRMTVWLKEQGAPINRKRLQRLMRLMGLEGLAPGPPTSAAQAAHPRYPYWLRDVPVMRPNQAWGVDITSGPMAVGFLYLVASMDWCIRYVVGWAVSNSLDADFCLEALEQAFGHGAPDIFKSDQGVQFTSQAWIERVERAGSRVRMDGRGRAFDNILSSLSDCGAPSNMKTSICGTMPRAQNSSEAWVCLFRLLQ